MTEPEARAALRAFVAVGEIEQWIAEQRWEPMAGGGWRVREHLQPPGIASHHCPAIHCSTVITPHSEAACRP